MKDPVAAILAVVVPDLPIDEVIVRRTPWLSATFEGMRIEMGFIAPRRPWLADVADTIGDMDIPIRGRFVADITMRSAPIGPHHLRVAIEALVLDDA